MLTPGDAAPGQGLLPLTSTYRPNAGFLMAWPWKS